MKPLFVVAFVTIGMLVAVACGRPKDDRPSEASTTSAALVASCETVAERGICEEYEGSGRLGLERSLCDAAKGRFGMTSCPTAGQVGWCTMHDGAVKRYYGSRVADPKSDCEGDVLKGRYTAVVL